MGSLLRKVQAFIHSPRGQRMVDKARRQMAKPEHQRRLQRLRHRFTGRHR